MPITVDECLAWFHLYGLRPAVSNMKKAKNSKWKRLPPTEIELAVPYFPVRRSNQSAIETVNALLLKLLVYLYTLLSINTWQCMYEVDFGQICIDTKGVWEGRGQRGHFWKCGAGHKWVCGPPFVTELRHSDLSHKICISFTNKDVIYYFLQNFVWTNQIITNFISCHKKPVQELDRQQDLNVLYQVCVFQVDRKSKMAAPAFDWLRHFRLLLYHVFLGRSVNKNGRPGRHVKKVAHCTRVYDMWPFGPLVCIIPLLTFLTLIPGDARVYGVLMKDMRLAKLAIVCYSWLCPWNSGACSFCTVCDKKTLTFVINFDP